MAARIVYVIDREIIPELEIDQIVVTSEANGRQLMIKEPDGEVKPVYAMALGFPPSAPLPADTTEIPGGSVQMWDEAEQEMVLGTIVQLLGFNDASELPEGGILSVTTVDVPDGSGGTISKKVVTAKSFSEVIGDDTLIYANENNKPGLETQTINSILQVKEVSILDQTTPSLSDIKKDIKPFQALENLKKDFARLELFTFRYKEDPPSHPLRLGVIVDNESTSPWFKSAKEDGVDMVKMTWSSAALIQDLMDRVSALEAEVEELKER